MENKKFLKVSDVAAMMEVSETPAITVTRNFLGQQTAEALLLELIRAHTQAA